jgi:hypothetical protein
MPIRLRKLVGAILLIALVGLGAAGDAAHSLDVAARFRLGI